MIVGSYYFQLFHSSGVESCKSFEDARNRFWHIIEGTALKHPLWCMASQKYIASTKWPSFQVWKTGNLESNPRFMPDFFERKFQVKQTKTLLQHWCSRLFRLKNVTLFPTQKHMEGYRCDWCGSLWIVYKKGSYTWGLIAVDDHHQRYTWTRLKGDTPLKK